LVLVAWLVLVVLLVLCGEGIKHSSAINSIDGHITDFVVRHRTTALNQLMKVVTWAGSWIAVFVVAAAVALLTWKGRLRPVAVVTVLTAWLGELLAVTLTKALVERHRPPVSVRVVAAHGWAFPSGHAANAVVVFSVAAALVSHLARSRIVEVLSWLMALFLMALVGFSRIELGVHWTTDVLAGAVWSGCWAGVAVWLLGPHRVPG
jgi:undecaprenyl-diphosphatase